MNDLISRQAAIEAIASRDETDGTVKVFTGREVNGILAELPSAQQWTPCSEMPPEESGDYLVTVAHHSGELWVEVDQFDNENGSWWHYMDDVTAWMPLPEPYKEIK